jgi:hypothetical protein
MTAIAASSFVASGVPLFVLPANLGALSWAIPAVVLLLGLALWACRESSTAARTSRLRPHPLRARHGVRVLPAPVQ